ncbi:hypothetical protein ACFXTO_030543 [Malus domestica]
MEKEGYPIELDGIPLAPAEINPKRGPSAIFILEKASLEVAKVGKTYQQLNSDDHSNFLRKNKKDPAIYRSDIVHQWWSAFGGRDSKSCLGVLLESSKERDNSTCVSSAAKAQGCLSLPAVGLKKRCPSLSSLSPVPLSDLLLRP